MMPNLCSLCLTLCKAACAQVSELLNHIKTALLLVTGQFSGSLVKYFGQCSVCYHSKSCHMITYARLLAEADLSLNEVNMITVIENNITIYVYISIWCNVHLLQTHENFMLPWHVYTQRHQHAQKHTTTHTHTHIHTHKHHAVHGKL